MIAAITGHQDLGDDSTERWVAKAIRAQLLHFKVSKGYSALARGADQLFAQQLLAHGGQLVAVVPSNGYEHTLNGVYRERYFELLGRAGEILELPYAEPCEDAFMAAGKAVIEPAKILIAVWNGLAARGKGGTGDAVEYARSQGKAVVHLNNMNKTIRYINGPGG